MGQSKALYELMQQGVYETPFPTKKEITNKATEMVTALIESGEKDVIEAFCEAVRMNEALKVITSELKDKLPGGNFERFGIKAVYRSGGETLNFKEDPVWAGLKKQMEDREAFLKLALKSNEPVFSEYGEVPKVSTTPKAGSVAITF